MLLWLIWSTPAYATCMVMGLLQRWRGMHQLLKIRVIIEGVPAVALIDSGATHSFVSSQWVKRHRVHCADLVGSGLRVTVADGRTQDVTQCLPCASVKLGGVLRQTHKLVVADLAEEVILGQDWLQTHNPRIDWRRRTVSLSRSNGRGRDVCLPAVSTTPTGQAAEPEFVVSHLRAKRLLKKPSTTAFILLLRSVDDVDVALYNVKLQWGATGDMPGAPIQVPACDVPEIAALLREYADVFQAPKGLPPDRGDGGHRIFTEPGVRPPYRPPFKSNIVEQEELQRQLAELLEKGWIRPSSSMYGAPIMFIRKPDGTLRSVIDYRALNKQTVRDRYPLPLISECLDQLGGCSVFSRFDLASGFHQMLMHPDDIHKTAFTTRYGLFEWTVLPMGLCNAPSSFMRQMAKVFSPYLDKFLILYVDDLLVKSQSMQEHIEHLRQVLQRMREQKLYAKPSKCEFGKSELKFLGHIVSRQGVKPDPGKVKALQDWPVPQTVHELRSFMGLANYFRRFVRGFSRTAVPLTNLLNSKGKLVDWGPEQDIAFQQLKAALASAPVLRVADPRRPFLLNCDASDHAIGGVLLQEFAGALHPIAFHSRKLNSAERNYTVTEREMLSIVECVKEWSHYIAGTSTLVQTDHKSLQHFWSQPKLPGRQTRWMELLQAYDIDIAYIKGTTNVVADALSRRPDHTQVSVNSVNVSGVSGLLMQELQMAAKADSAYQRMLQRVQAGELGNHYTAEGLILHVDRQRRSRVVVPNSTAVKGMIMAECHDVPMSGHLGYSKTHQRIVQLFEWPGMAADLKSYVTSCPVCAAAKSATQAPLGLLKPLPVPEGKWQSVAMDFITHLPVTKSGYDALLVVTDRMTKMVRCIPTKTTATAPDTAKLFVEQVVRFYGVPLSIVSDRDSKFTGDFWRCLFGMLGTKLAMSSSYHPQTDGQSERSNRSVQQVLRCYCGSFPEAWDAHLSLAEFSLNSAVSDTTGFSPFKLMYGYEPLTPIAAIVNALSRASGSARRVQATAEMLDSLTFDLLQARQAMAKAQEQQATQANKHRRDATFAVGDLVHLSTANLKSAGTSRKFKPRWCGPFVVAQVINPVSVKLTLPPEIRIHPVVHISQVKPYVAEAKWGKRDMPPAPILDNDGKQSYIVEGILAHRVERAAARNAKPKYSYLVKWQGYPVWDCSWEPEAGFPANGEHLGPYKRQHGLT
jgi:hypothetical protein